MRVLDKYRFGFDVWGLVLFFIIMIPNFIWFAVPAENDVLRTESITPVIDMIASIAQVTMIITLCIIKRSDNDKPGKRSLLLIIVLLVVLYGLGWIAYYMGNIGLLTILDLCIAPSLAFIVFAIYRRNYPTLILAMIFTVCHVIFGVVNFII
ncbi:hypothetical protein HMP0721_0926 [Pseudoramibacter alactolyticus ATCC 23263]|uniref:Uncharacterized protein n=1 Tax=Pseudoramibacter alactolyticus ATCC 23263 TaxID=887929 RepID=E6MFZ3_9FIRM|nr:hypothetical protein [Pseudoramibacter alactolyticus]EFV01533.1 hypothetical protein HMP0721_0926 [Pseudoramibacter alactolyticus ATCC 23263]